MNLPVSYNRETHELIIRKDSLSSLVEEGSIHRSVAHPGDMLVRDQFGLFYAITPEAFEALWYRSGGPRQ